MWEAIGLSVLTIVSILIGYGMGKDNSKPAQYVQNIYTPAIDAKEVYKQTKALIEDGKKE